MTRPAMQVAARTFGSRVSVDDIVTTCLFLGAFLFFWISVDPFVDLTDPAVLLPAAGSNTLNQAVVLGLALNLFLYAAFTDTGRFGILLNWPMLLLLGWLAVSVATSVDPGLSGRRVLLTMIVFGIVAIVLMLPRDVERFADLLAVAALIVLAISYGSVLLLPKYAVHQAGELLEPEHAGHWRGPFTHKNGAGAAMVLCLYIGFYVAKRRSFLLGWIIVIAAGFFLMRTMAKTSMALVVPCLILTWLVVSVRSSVFRYLIVLGTLGALTLITVGSVVFPPVAAFNASAMADPSFTNRTDIWSFSVASIAERPLLGHGFEAFWGSEDVFFGESTSWANRATDSHNGYLDTLLGIGLPGLGLVLWLFVIGPLRDLKLSERSGNDPATTMFFMRIWTFGVFFAGLETFFFANGGPVWFMFLLAVFGMRFQAQARHVARSGPRR